LLTAFINIITTSELEIHILKFKKDQKKVLSKRESNKERKKEREREGGALTYKCIYICHCFLIAPTKCIRAKQNVFIQV